MNTAKLIYNTMCDCKNKIRVAHVVHIMSHGGIETFLMSVLRGYDRSKFVMDIVYTGEEEGKYAEEAKDLGARLIPCSLGRDQVRFVRCFLKILKEGKYNAVNSHISDMGAGAIWAAKKAGIPSRVASYHESLSRQIRIKAFYREILRKTIVRDSTAITVSSDVVNHSHFSKMNVPAGKINSIPYGVDTDYFSRLPNNRVDLKRLGFDDDCLIVGHVGRYVSHKNHQALLDIASKVIPQVPRARFLLCGASTGPLRQVIDQKIDMMGLRTYFGMIEGLKDIREFYSSIDVFVLPSVLEGMPVSLIEAQASSKPVVASNLNGIVEATAPDMQQNLFDVSDIDSFVRTVIDLLLDKNKRNLQGQAGQKYVRENLDIKVAIKKYESLYLQEGIMYKV